MSTNPAPPKHQRLEARVTAEQKALFQRAADLEGRSLTDFMTSSLQDAAESAIARYERIVLSSQDSAAFVATLLDPPVPTPELQQAARRYRAFRDAQAS